jgi:predicted GNAT family N-acyltransferase
MKSDLIQYRMMQAGEEAEVFALVKQTFQEFVGRDYSQEGINTFFRSVTLESIKKRPQENHFIMVAYNNNSNKIIGVLDIRGYNHISLFFVDKAYHQRGIGRALLDKALERCKNSASAVTQIDVHASPFSVPIYEKLGFHQAGAETTSDGIRFIPMMREVVQNK